MILSCAGDYSHHVCYGHYFLSWFVDHAPSPLLLLIDLLPVREQHWTMPWGRGDDNTLTHIYTHHVQDNSKLIKFCESGVYLKIYDILEIHCVLSAY